MEYREYFESTRGRGVLSTADSDGRVDSAVYARPHVMENNTLAFIMRKRRSYDNLVDNPHACYLFIEEGPSYAGLRLYLTRVHEDEDPDVIETLRRREPAQSDEEPKAVVYFQVDEKRPLVGG